MTMQQVDAEPNTQPAKAFTVDDSTFTVDDSTLKATLGPVLAEL